MTKKFHSRYFIKEKFLISEVLLLPVKVKYFDVLPHSYY